MPVNKDHQRVSLLAHEWMLEDSIWIENNALELIIPGAAHAIFLIWRGTDHQLVNWYVNFQEPIRRSPYGFDSLDYELDIVVTPDGQRWKWKDKELFQELVKRHIFSQEEASAIWNEAYAVLSLLEDQKHPLIGSSWQE